VTNEDFRRELNQVFDQMSGSPSPSLRDRVRSSVSQAPEERGGPYWIAAVAACVIALLIVGVLLVGNPLNRRQSNAGPGVQPSPTATASSTPEANLPPFQCGSSRVVLDYARPPSPALIDALRTGTHPGYDRLTIEWTSGPPVPTGPTSVDLEAQSGTAFTQGPSGRTVTLAGRNGILVVIHGADLHTSYSGPTDIKTGLATLVEVKQVEDFEGVVQLALGIDAPSCYRSFFLSNPNRLVIDIQAGS
jgi:hypothetical protein